MTELKADVLPDGVYASLPEMRWVIFDDEGYCLEQRYQNKTTGKCYWGRISLLKVPTTYNEYYRELDTKHEEV